MQSVEKSEVMHRSGRMPLIMMKRPDEKFVVLSALIRLGRASEPFIEGAHALEHYVIDGTKKYPTREKVYSAITDVGGTLRAETHDAVTAFTIMVPSSHMELGVDVLTQIVFAPRLLPQKLTNVRKAIQVELERRVSDDSYRISSLFSRALFDTSSYGYRPDVRSRLKALSKLKRSDLLKLYESAYHPNNMVFGAAGKFNATKLQKLLRAAIGNVKPRKEMDMRETAVCNVASLRLSGNPRASLIRIGTSTKGLTEKEYLAARVAKIIIGGRPNARLGESLRNKLKISYSTGASMHALEDSLVTFYAYADSSAQNTAKVIKAATQVLYAARNKGFSTKEVRTAIKSMTGRMLCQDSVRYELLSVLYDYVIWNRVLSPQTLVRQLKKLTKKDVSDVVKRLLPANKKLLSVAIVGGQSK